MSDRTDSLPAPQTTTEEEIGVEDAVDLAVSSWDDALVIVLGAWNASSGVLRFD